MAAERDRCEVNTLVETPECSATEGVVRWDPVHSLWNGSMLAATVILAPRLFSLGALLVFVGLTGTTLLLGHSVGFHRRLIHRSFDCPLWLERTLVWLGTCVGMSGPFWMIRSHDLRDWAQRQPDCHDYLAHRQPMLVDAWWQLHCRLELDAPPQFDLRKTGRDRFYRFLEATWMVQQLPIALLLFGCGGWGWVVWGVCVRVCASVTGHWFVGHLAHRTGPQTWLVIGEAWHNNHHAFPGSARIGIYPGQSDWGYAFIVVLQRLGLAWNVVLPEHLGREHALTNVAVPDPSEPRSLRSLGGA